MWRRPPGWKPLAANPDSYHLRAWQYSGVEIPDKSVVIFDAANSFANGRLAITRIAAITAFGVYGVVVGGAIANGEAGMVCYWGRATALMTSDNGIIAVGDAIVTSNHALGYGGRVESGGSPAGSLLGFALEVVDTAAEEADIWVDPR